MSYEEKRLAHLKAWEKEQDKCECDEPERYMTNTEYCKHCDNLISK